MIFRNAITTTVCTFTLAFALLGRPTLASAATTSERAFKNLTKIAADIGLYNYRSIASERTLKIAILDNGFKGYAGEIGKTLPAGVQYHAGPIAVDESTEEMHGLAMAQILSGLLKEASPKLDYELHLFSAFGYSNLKKAVETVSAERYDVVLYSQVWEYGGNGDGRGFINQLINKAAQNGVIWINAAGNYGNSTYRGEIKKGEDDWAKLPGANSSIPVRCQENSSKKCQLRVVLSWNDFSDDAETGTDKDLDLVLTDDALKIVQTSALTQMKKVDANAPGGSLYPREIVQAEVKPGLYYIRAKVRSSNFTKRDELRVTVGGDFITMQNATVGETLLSPADNENVITVGASDSEKSAYSKQFGKPEILTASAVITKKDETFKGTSNSAAITAAAVTLMKAVAPSLTRGRVLALLANASGVQGRLSPIGEGAGLPLDLLGFGPTGQDCFRQTNLPYFPQALRALSEQTRVYIVESTYGPKVFTTDDPFELMQQERGGNRSIERYDQDDMLVVNQQGFDVLPRTSLEHLPFGTFEVVQQPAGQAICTTNGKAPASTVRATTLRLPKPSDVR